MSRIEIRDVLAFESKYPVPSGAKDQAIRVAFGVRPARYYQILRAAAATREALELDPFTTNRVRAALEQRTHTRIQGRTTR